MWLGAYCWVDLCCSYLAMPGNTSDGDLWNPPDAETCESLSHLLPLCKYKCNTSCLPSRPPPPLLQLLDSLVVIQYGSDRHLNVAPRRLQGFWEQT